METNVIAVGYNHILKDLPCAQARELSDDQWIEKHGSGTLRKNRQLGFAWKSQYYDERTHWEFGAGALQVPRSRVTFGDALTEGDCKPITEAGWYIDRFLVRNPFAPYEKWVTKFFTVDGGPSGIGLVCQQTTAPFIRDGYILLILVAPWNAAKNSYEEAIPL